MNAQRLLVIIMIFFGLVSCKSNYTIIGSWEEKGYNEETLRFEENGTMELGDMKGPLSFQYEILERNKDTVKLNITILDKGEIVKTTLHSIVFNKKNCFTIKNLEIPEVKPSTYIRQ